MQIDKRMQHKKGWFLINMNPPFGDRGKLIVKSFGVVLKCCRPVRGLLHFHILAFASICNDINSEGKKMVGGFTSKFAN